MGRIRVPIGLIGIVYESRPNVTADSAALCLKSGNGVILRGGSEAINSNLAIVKILQDSLKEAGIPKEAVSFIEMTDRQAVLEMLKQDKYIDLIIPRGGEGLINMVTENSRIPVIKHDKGVCHTYVDEFANLDMARDICMNAKVQRPGTCNAMECHTRPLGNRGGISPLDCEGPEGGEGENNCRRESQEVSEGLVRRERRGLV